MSSYIDREAVDDMIYDYSRSCDVNYGQLSERLYAIPSADVRENIHGEWIDKGNGSYVCSNCKTEWTTSQIEKMCFCPTCGNPKVRGDKAE